MCRPIIASPSNSYYRIYGWWSLPLSSLNACWNNRSKKNRWNNRKSHNRSIKHFEFLFDVQVITSVNNDVGNLCKAWVWPKAFDRKNREGSKRNVCKNLVMLETEERIEKFWNSVRVDRRKSSEVLGDSWWLLMLLLWEGWKEEWGQRRSYNQQLWTALFERTLKSLEVCE